MCVSQDHHQPGDQPSRNDANLLQEACLDPEKKVIRLLERAGRRHLALSSPMPAQVTLLLFNRFLKHRLQPTISAPPRSSASCRITQCSPSPGRRHEVDLSIECPFSPLLPDAIAHHHSRDVVVSALMCLIDPLLDDFHADDLHVEQLDIIVEARHVSHDWFSP